MNGLLRLAVEIDTGALGAFLLTSALKATVLLGIAGLAVLLLRRRPAAWRHLVWALAIAAALMAPLLLPFAPRWEVPGLRLQGSFIGSGAEDAVAPGVAPQPRPDRIVSSEAATPSPAPAPAAAGPTVSARSAGGSGSPSAASAHAASADGVTAAGSGRATSGMASVESTTAAGQPNAAATETTRPRESARSPGVFASGLVGRSVGRESSARRWPPGLWLAGLWLGGILLVSISFFRSLRGRQRLAGEARRVTGGPLYDATARLAAELGTRRRIVFLVGPAGCMPMTWGAIRPRLLLPASASGWPAPRLQAVLVHELAHVRRLDYVVRVFACLACILYWFNPLVWLAARRLRFEGELACDDQVLRAGTLPSEYASQLIAIARAQRPGRLVGALALPMARTSQLGRRVRAALDPARGRDGLGRTGLIGALLSATLALLAVAGAALGGGGDERTPEPSEAPVPAPGVRFVQSGFDVSSRPEDVAVRTTRAGEERSSEPQVAAGRPRPASGERALVSTTELADDGQVDELPVRSVQAAGALCDWEVHRPTSTSVNVNDERYRIKIQRDDDCELEIQLDGELEVNDAETEVTGISAGGALEIEEQRGRESRRLLIEQRGGDLARRWWVDGRELAYDPAAAAWLGDMLSLLFRRAGYQAQERAEKILARDGVEGLLDEISLISSDHVARRYYTVLLTQADLDPRQVGEIVGRLGEQIDSDHELARLLIAIAEKHPLDRAVQAAYVEAAGSIDSDHELARVLLAILSRDDLDPEVAGDMLGAASTIDSDHELARLLTALLERGRLDEAQADALAKAVAGIDSDFEKRRVLMAIVDVQGLDGPFGNLVLESASDIGSDHEMGRLLRAVAERYPDSRPLPPAYFAAARSIDSDFELSRTLIAVVEREPGGEEDVRPVLDLALQIGSDHELARLLREVAGRYPVDGDLRPAFMQAVDSIESSHERGRVLDAAFSVGGRR